MSTRYLLLDGVRYEQALERLYRRDEELQIEPLYAGTPWQDLADLGPILLGLHQDSTLWQEVDDEPEWHAAAAILTSPAPMTQIADHLRQFNQVTDTQGSAYLLRYADPLVAWFWLNSFGSDTAIHVLGPISQWHIVRPQVTWQPADAGWQVFDGPARSHCIAMQSIWRGTTTRAGSGLSLAIEIPPLCMPASQPPRCITASGTKRSG
ncbi:DUF4123 domain-containing protein [Halopseudomonas sp. SMJS2]|uniref:DUF4123 domain-containing protein n=1 Tax=Halopseudomonas sp. SMJS2 TaxID=3041098 RepID=UPI0024530203|nr:DUF4123 domain-containing protein [Halopseudomonas sp. SMJS2]WGK62405.1 DUF4123 domain-containing protein [Halopseudomonas sp. SMJS2]